MDVDTVVVGSGEIVVGVTVVVSVVVVVGSVAVVVVGSVVTVGVVVTIVLFWAHTRASKEARTMLRCITFFHGRKFRVERKTIGNESHQRGVFYHPTFTPPMRMRLSIYSDSKENSDANKHEHSGDQLESVRGVLVLLLFRSFRSRNRSNPFNFC